MTKVLKNKCLTIEKSMIKCIVTGKCPFCKVHHNKTETILIQADGKILYSLEDARGFGFAQCINCSKPLPLISYFPDGTRVRKRIIKNNEVKFMEMEYVKPQDYALSLSKHKRDIYSQNGEDGILEYIFNTLNIPIGCCCEFGAWNGSHLSNTFNFIKHKEWKGVLIESDPDKFKELQKTREELDHPGNVAILNKNIHYLPGKGESLDTVLSGTIIPDNFELLSIDVDGPDYHIWKSLKNYQPKIVVIEHSGITNYIIQREGAIHKKDIDGSTSFQPMRDLGEDKGYILLVDTGNLIFIHKKYFSKLL